MRLGTVAFLLGVVFALQLPELPDSRVGWLLPWTLLALWMGPGGRIPACFVLGILWTVFRAGLALSVQLAPALEGVDLEATGTVSGVPYKVDRVTRFEFRIDELRQGDRLHPSPGLVRLAWYEDAPVLAPGEQWRLRVRLKRPHGFANPGGFDFEAWLLAARIRATGYVRGGARGPGLAVPMLPGLSRLRVELDTRLRAALAEHRHGGVVRALALGLRDGITGDHWQVFRTTGTAHLMAISGLHVGMVAGLVFLLSRRLWAWSGPPALWLASPRAAVWPALAAAALYAGLAGFSVPTQRALLMLGVFLGSLWLRVSLAPSHGLALALALILVLDPLAVLSGGFWLSFGAVAAILLGLSGRVRTTGLWWRHGRVHGVVAVGLLPAMLALFQESPWLSPLANLLAVPWVGLVVLPLALAGTLALLLWPALGELLLHLCTLALDGLWLLLAPMAGLDLVYHAPRADGVVLLVAGIGAALLLLPRGLPGRWIGLVLFLPLLFPQQPRPEPGSARLTVLDVGQGLAVVVQTRSRVLIYDTGPRLGPDLDAGRAVLLPFLRATGISRVDLLVVSHGDDDHAGGVASLRAAMPVERILSSTPMRWPGARACRRGQSWRWDEVRFRMLGPPEGAARSGNEGSCVLHIAARGGSVLLPGDIGRASEAELIARYGSELRARLLVAPHHGSRTSSSAAFLNRVAPDHAVFSAGYRNRFGFPRPDVLARYRSRGVRLHETAAEGAIRVDLPAVPGPLRVTTYRDRHRRFWHGR